MKTFWAATAAGWLIIGVAIVGVLREHERTYPVDFARWFVGAALGHDLLLAPLVLLVGVALARVVSPAVRPAVTGGLFVAGVITLYALPLLFGAGRRPSNPSALPDNYWAGLGLVVAAIAVVTMMHAAVRRRRARSAAEQSNR